LERDSEERSQQGGSFGSSLMRATEEGRPGAVLIDRWQDVRSALAADPAHVEDAVVAAGHMMGLPASTLVPEVGLASAVLSRGRVVSADPEFAALFAVQDAELVSTVRRLSLAARKSAPAYGVLPTRDGRRAIAALASVAVAERWPLAELTRRALQAQPAEQVVLVYAPTMAARFARLVATAYGLTPAEVRVAVAAVEQPTLGEVAKALGLSQPTVRQHMRSLLRKTGADRRAELVTRLTDVVAGEHARAADRASLVRQVFALTRAEGRVALLAAQGQTLPQIATSLGVSQHTVRSQIDSVLAKTGARRVPEVARLFSDLHALACFVTCGETQRYARTRLLAATRVLAAPDGRRVVYADYGPAGGAPLLCFHGSYSTRWLPQRMVGALQAKGLRPIAIDRPGFGLTDPAADREPAPFERAADDAELVIARLELQSVQLFARDGGVGAALALAARLGDRVDTGVLLTPRPPTIHERDRHSFIATLRKATLGNPRTIAATVELLRRQGSAEFLIGLMRHMSGNCAADRAALDDPGFRQEFAAMAVAAAARTTAGPVGEHHAYGRAWSPPARIGGKRWVVIATGNDVLFHGTEREAAWRMLPGLRIVSFADAGRLAYFTHSSEIAGLLPSA